MSKKHNYRENNRKTKENYSENFMFPKHKGEKERQSGMTGKEKIIAVKDAVEK